MAMQRAQQMAFPHMMVGGQPQHPYAHQIHMSQGPPQQPGHPGMGPPQQPAVHAPNFQPRGQSQGPPNQQSGPGGAQQGPPQGQQPPRGGPGGADTQAPPPASTPPQGPPSLGHNGPPAPPPQQEQSQQPPQGPPAHSGPPSGTSTLTRERKRIAIIDPTTRQEVSVDGTSADKKVRVHPCVPSVLTLILTQKFKILPFSVLFAHLNPVYCQLGSHSGRITHKTNCITIS